MADIWRLKNVDLVQACSQWFKHVNAGLECQNKYLRCSWI